jgi:hypothetical protein
MNHSTGTVSPFLEASSFLLDSEEEILQVLSILARIMHDSQFDSASTRNGEEGATTPRSRNVVMELRSTFVLGRSRFLKAKWRRLGRIKSQIEEVDRVICILYGIGRWTGREGGSGSRFNADFFLWVSDLLIWIIQDASCHFLCFSSIALCVPFTLI